MVKTISVKIPRPLAARLSAAVHRRKATQSLIVREALEAHLRTGASSDIGSFLELARDIVGSVVGPVDLSTSRRHLHRYGR